MAPRPRILRTVLNPPSDDTAEPAVEAIDPAFHEATYLRAFPDIADAVRRGLLPSGLAHYQQSGQAEGRLSNPQYLALLEARTRAIAPVVTLDTVMTSAQGTRLILGWIDDRSDPLTGISLETSPGQRQNWTAIPRLIRQDVARSLNAPAPHRFGFLLLSAGGIGLTDAANPAFHFESGAEAVVSREPLTTSDRDQRDIALAALVDGADDASQTACFSLLDQHAGLQIAGLNKLIADQSAAQCSIERTGPRRSRYRASVITTCRGPADQIVPRLTLMAAGAGAEEIEYIVVIDDPTRFEAAQRAARLVGLTTGAALTLVFQPDGDETGLGDAAVEAAQSDRLIFMDQSILPRDPQWAATHNALVADAPADQTRLMGGLLYDTDGGLTGGGRSFSRAAPDHEPPVRIETIVHPAPSFAPHLTQAHPVAAPSPGLLSVDRGWFEKAGGFSRQYHRGDAEELDLCLRAREGGVQPWVHPLPMWAFRGPSAARPESSAHVAILSDWLLHRRWDAKIAASLPRPDEA
jgi:hypothetical protein